MKRIIAVVLIFGFGAVSGILVEKRLHKPQEDSPALQGCEAIASAVNEMLMECEWKLTDAQHRYVEQVERNNTLIETFMPDHLGEK